MNNVSAVQFSATNAAPAVVGDAGAANVSSGEGSLSFSSLLNEAAQIFDVPTDTEFLPELGEELQEILAEQIIAVPQQIQQMQQMQINVQQAGAELEESLALSMAGNDVNFNGADFEPEYVAINYSQNISGEVEVSTMGEQVLEGLAPLMPKVDSEVSHDMEELASAILAYADPSKPAPKVSELPKVSNKASDANNVSDQVSVIEVASSTPQKPEEAFVPTSKIISSELLDELAAPAQAVADQATQQNIPQTLEALLSNTTSPNELKHQVTPLEEKLLSMNQHAQAPNYLKDGEIEVSPKDQLVAKVQQLANTGVKQVTMQLHPAELGEVTVQMDWDENEAISKVTFLVEKAESFDLLQQEAGKLAVALTEQRLISDQASLRLVMQSENQSNHSNFAGQNGNNQNFANSNNQHKHHGVPVNYPAGIVGVTATPALASMLADGYVDILV